jgi:hypothetical protein
MSYPRAAIAERDGVPAVEDFQNCLALAYHKLGRQTDAETAPSRYKAREGDAGCAIHA